MVYAMPDPVAAIDRRGRIVAFNKSAAGLFLVDEKDVLGKQLRGVIGTGASLVDGALIAAHRKDGVLLTLTVTVISTESPHDIIVFRSGDAAHDPNDDLSPRQREILSKLTQGLSEKAIADALSLSPHTVHDHVKAVYRKYGVMSRAELLATVLNRGPR
jgi:DNA-binding CsgD family transcriptional regulator